MKILILQIDVSNLSEEELESLTNQIAFTLPNTDDLLNHRIVQADEETSEIIEDEDDDGESLH